jgi:hypothetical protein
LRLQEQCQKAGLEIDWSPLKVALAELHRRHQAGEPMPSDADAVAAAVAPASPPDAASPVRRASLDDDLSEPAPKKSA